MEGMMKTESIGMLGGRCNWGLMSEREMRWREVDVGVGHPPVVLVIEVDVGAGHPPWTARAV